MRDFDRYDKQITHVQTRIEPATGKVELILTAPDGATFGPFYGDNQVDATATARAALVPTQYTLVA